MITLAAVLSRLPALDEPQLLLWIEQDWVRPMRRSGELLFEEIDFARLRLILELRELEVGDGAMPVVLSLLDQLHATRRQLWRIVQTLERDRPG